MLCANCGKEVTGRFCSECGTPAPLEETAMSTDTSGESVVDFDTGPDKKGFWSNVKGEVKKKHQLKVEKEQALKERLKQMDKEGIPYCPKCYSTSLSANKKGFGVGKAIVGAALTGGIGLVAGNIGAKKVRLTCLKCGHQFWAGKK